MGRGKAPAAALPMSELQTSILTQLSRNHQTGQQEVKRIRILLLGSQGVDNSQVKREVGVSYNTVLTWRTRWKSAYHSLLRFEEEVAQGNQKERALIEEIRHVLRDEKRSGAPKTFSLVQRQAIVALSCEAPSDYGLVMTNWTHETLAQTAIAKGIVTSISASHLGKILKKSPLTTA